MKNALDGFMRNIARARVLGGLHQTLASSTAPILDITDLLRAELVLAVSAFDHLIHELARIGIQEAMQSKRPITVSLQKFTISLEAVQQALANPLQTNWLDTEVRGNLGWQSFQKPEKVAEAMRLISGVKLWDSVATALGLNVADVKASLDLIVQRRNKIAHEADLDPTDPSLTTRWPINRQDIETAVDFLEKVGIEIYNAVK